MGLFAIKDLRTTVGGPFSFSVARGECLALSGPSGCGKTLLLRALADLDPAEGSVVFDGRDRNEMTASEWRRQVGWLPAEPVWWYETVGDHFSHPWKKKRKRRVQPPARGSRPPPPVQALEKLGFDKTVMGWRIDRLSTGEKQRLALVRLLLNQPQVLLLDEPTAALDRMHAALVEELVAACRRETGAAVVWVSHDPQQRRRVADRSFEFLNGGLEERQ